jgi:thioredoxin 1
MMQFRLFIYSHQNGIFDISQYLKFRILNNVRYNFPSIFMDNVEKIRENLIREIMAENKDSSEGKTVDLSDSTFNSMVSKPGVTVVDFWAPWCGPCRFVSPVVEELASEYRGKARFGKVNVDENPGVSNQFMIRSIPTIMFFRDGKMVDMQIGAVPKPMLEAKLKKALQ